MPFFKIAIQTICVEAPKESVFHFNKVIMIYEKLTWLPTSNAEPQHFYIIIRKYFFN